MSFWGRSARPRKRSHGSLGKLSILTAISSLATLPGQPLVADDNQALREEIALTTGAHNLALPISIAPVPGQKLAEVTTFLTNLRLKRIPAPFTAPQDVQVYPNSADMCSYEMRIPQTEAEYQNLLGIWDIKPLPSNWGPLGAPQVEHGNSSVLVSVNHQSSVPFARTRLLQTTVFPAGNFQFQWQAETRQSPLFDVTLPIVMFGFNEIVYSRAAANLLDDGSDAARMAKNYLDASETLAAIATELGLISGDILSNEAGFDDGVTKAIHADAEHLQTFTVYDVFDPLISTSQEVVSFEATDIGGTYYERIRAGLFDTIQASDPCGRAYSLSNDAPFLFELGTTELNWTVQDLGPSPQGGSNSATLRQTVVISDTQAPILVPPSGIVLETTSSGLDSGSVSLGVPKVVDLADSQPDVSNDVPDFFPVNSRTEVLWSATDDANNTSTANQLVTVKPVGANTTPFAHAKTASTLTAAPVEIVLSGTDEDIIDGVPDPLGFAIETQPQNGEFIAPLYPFFIEDYRTQPEGPFGEGFLTASPRSAYVYENYCEPENVPWDFVFEPVYMHVTDDGTQFIFDYYWTCDQGNRRGRTNERVSKWDKDGNYLGQTDVSDDTLQQFVLDRDGNIYFISSVGSGSSTDLFLRRCSTDFGTNSTQCDTSWKFNYGSAPGIDPNNLVYARVDSAQDIAYVTDKRRIYAFDISSNNGESDYLGALKNGEQFLQACSAGGSRSGFTMEVDSASNLYITDQCSDHIHKFEPSGYNAEGQFEAGDYIGWLGRCDSSTNNACDEDLGRSKGYSCTDETCLFSDSAGSEQGQFNQPQHIALDPNDILYVADYANDRIQRFAPDGSFVGEAVSTGTGINQGAEPGFILGNFDSPRTVSVNSSQFFIVDKAESFVHVFKTSPFSDVTDDSATVTYVSDFNFHSATDSFTYTVSDGLATSEPVAVNVSVSRNFRAPTVMDRQISGLEDNTVDFQLSGDDPDGVIGTDDINPLDNLSFSVLEQPQNGTVVGGGSSFTYIPEPDFNGTDSFTYVASDGVLSSEPATVSVEIESENDSPEILSITADTAAIGFSTSLVVSFSDDLFQDERTIYSFIDWGDGVQSANGSEEVSVLSPFEPGGEGLLTASHTYTSEGSRSVQVCLIDFYGRQDCQTEVIIVSPRAALAMGVSPSAQEVAVSEEITYTVELVNLAPEGDFAGVTAEGVTSNHEVPPALSIQSIDSGSASCTIINNEVSCDVGSLSPGQGLTMTVTARNEGSTLVDLDDDFNVVSLTSSDSTREYYLGYTLTTILADSTDLDGDGIYDAFEAANGLDSFSNDAAADLDGDGLSNLEEFQAGTAANNGDTDDDGISDSWELANGLDPLRGNDATLDSDNDGFTNLQEFLADRNPLVDEQSGDRLVPVLSEFNAGFLSVPAMLLGADHFDLELELIQSTPTILFQLNGFDKRSIMVEVPDSNTFNPENGVLALSAVDVDGVLYYVELQLVSESPVQLQLLDARAATVVP